MGPAAIVDWLQNAAAVHCEQAGWSIDRLREEGSVWFVRELELKLEAPARHLDPIEVETWVSDLRRFRTHREYLVRSGDRVVARAQADWLFLGTTKTGGLRPRRPPQTMKDSFPFDETTAFGAETPLAFPDADIDTRPRLERTIMPSELDENGHVNHAVYLDWIEDEAALNGRPALERVRLEFLDDAGPGDAVKIASGSMTPRLEEAVRIEEGGRCLVRANVLRGPGA